MKEIINSVLENTYKEEGYIIRLEGIVDVYIDSYEEGEGDHVNYWRLDTFSFNVSTLTGNEEEIKCQVIRYLNQYLFNDIGEDDKINLFSDFIDNRISWGQMCEVNNLEPNEYELEQWKLGEEELYYQHIDVSVYINDIEVSESDMYKIFQ